MDFLMKAIYVGQPFSRFVQKGFYMIACGIDFGTSNSAIALARDGAVTAVQVEGAHETLPSAIFYYEDGRAVYGRQASESFYAGDVGRLMRSFKRTLGTDLVEFGAIINGKLKRFDHIIAGFIRYMKNRAEAAAGAGLEHVVMGRPVRFVEDDTAADALAQDQLEAIGRLVGFKHVEFQFEPIAAAFAHEREITGEKLALVVDIGGGTSDFSVIRLSGKGRDAVDRKSDICSNVGVRIGGNDLDRDFCLRAFMPSLGYGSRHGAKDMLLPLHYFHDMAEWSKVNTLYVPRNVRELKEMLGVSHAPEKLARFVRAVEKELGHRLLTSVEAGKITLTGETRTVADIGYLDSGFSLPLTRDEFDLSVGSRIDSIDQGITECLKLAGLGDADIELIILTGGSTEVVCLKDRVRNRFPAAAISEKDKLSSVCTGLGFDSLRRFAA